MDGAHPTAGPDRPIGAVAERGQRRVLLVAGPELIRVAAQNWSRAATVMARRPIFCPALLAAGTTAGLRDLPPPGEAG